MGCDQSATSASKAIATSEPPEPTQHVPTYDAYTVTAQGQIVTVFSDCRRHHRRKKKAGCDGHTPARAERGTAVVLNGDADALNGEAHAFVAFRLLHVFLGAALGKAPNKH